MQSEMSIALVSSTVAIAAVQCKLLNIAGMQQPQPTGEKGWCICASTANLHINPGGVKWFNIHKQIRVVVTGTRSDEPSAAAGISRPLAWALLAHSSAGCGSRLRSRRAIDPVVNYIYPNSRRSQAENNTALYKQHAAKKSV